MAALFPIVTFSRLVRGVGFMFFAVVASFGYLLPFALFFIMAREQNDDEMQADK
jgi:ATP/ADP translocase